MLVYYAMLMPEILQPDIVILVHHVDVAVFGASHLVRHVRQSVARPSRYAHYIRKFYSMLHEIIEHTASEHTSHAPTFEH